MEDRNMNTENQMKQKDQRDQNPTTTSRTHNGSSKMSGKTIEDLESEWDIEKIVEISAAVVTIASVLLAGNKSKQVNKLGETVASLLGVDSLKNWRPPTPFLRGLGFRTREEIDREIKSLRG
jgi:hypothetical protein